MEEEKFRLRNVMQQKLRETKSKNTDVVFLLDSSESVSHHDYNIGLEACEAIVKAMDRSKTQVGVLRFSSGVDVIHPINSDVSLAIQNLTRAKGTKSGRGTNTSGGLREAQKMLASTGRTDAVKIVWLFTDGRSKNSQKDAVAVGESLRASNVTIYGVGIGNVSKDQLEQVCGKETTFTTENYNILLTSIMSSDLGSEITIAIDQKKKRSFKLKENLLLDVTIKNIGTGVVAKGSVIEIASGGYYQKVGKFIDKALESGKSTTVSIELEPSDIVSIDTLPEQVLVNVYKPNSDIPHQSNYGGFQIEIANLAGDLVDWNSRVPGYEKTKANIIIFGPVGQGKSSLINSMISLTHRTYQQWALSLQSDKRVTTETEHFGELAGFGFLDTQGFVEGNYLNSEFSLLLKGALPIGYDVVQGTADLSRVVKKHEGSAVDRRIHSCIFVVSQTFRYLAKDDPSVLKMKQFIDDGKKFNLKPILAVTQMDEVHEKEVNKVRKEISALIGIDPSDIFLIANPPPTFHYGEKLEFKQEKYIYQLLWRSLEAAKTFMAQEKEAKENAKKAEDARKAKIQAQREEEKRKAEQAEEKKRIEKEQEEKKRQSFLQERELEELREQLFLEEEQLRHQINAREAEDARKVKIQAQREKFEEEKNKKLEQEQEETWKGKIQAQREKEQEEERKRVQEHEEKKARLIDEAEKRRKQLELEFQLEELRNQLRQEEEHQRILCEQRKRLDQEKEEQRKLEREATKMREEAKIKLQEIENQRLKDGMEAEKKRLEGEVAEARRKQEEEKILEELRRRDALRPKEKSSMTLILMVAILILFIAILLKF